MPEQKPPEKELKEVQKHLAALSKNKVPPLAVTSNYMDKLIVGSSNKKFANDRSLKKGCKYYIVDGRPVYLYQDLVEYYTRHPVQTTGQAH